MLPTGSFTSSFLRFANDKPLFVVKNMERYEPHAALPAEEAEAGLRERTLQTIQNLSVPSFSQRLSINVVSWVKQPLCFLSPLWINFGAVVNTVRFISLRIKIWNFEWSGKEVPDELRARMISLFWIAIEDLSLAMSFNIFFYLAPFSVFSVGALVGVVVVHGVIFPADSESQDQSFLRRLGVASLTVGEKREIYHFSQQCVLDLNKQTLGNFLRISTSDGLKKFRGKLRILNNTAKTYNYVPLFTSYGAIKDGDLWKMIQSFEEVEWEKLQTTDREILLKHKLLAISNYVQRKLGVSFNSNSS